MAKTCESCQATKNLPAKAPLYHWACDFAGPLLGKMFQIAVDAHSKWPEIAIMTTTTTTKTITALREIFSQNGIPRQIVSDNGPQFMSGEFSQFMSANRIEHIRSSPYHQASNGATERLVQTLKRALKAGHHSGMPLKQSLSAFLLRYRTTPHATTGVSSCSLLMGQELHTRPNLMSPDVNAQVRDKQMQQKVRHD